MLPRMETTPESLSTRSSRPTGTAGRRLRIAAPATIAAASLALVACGGSDPAKPGSVPTGDIAAIGTGGGAVSKAQFDRFLDAQLSGRSPLGGSIAGAIPLDPPAFSRCSAALAANEARNRQPKSSAATLKASCQAQYRQTRDAVESQLISYQWLVQEAADRGVKTDDAEVRRTLDQYIAAAASANGEKASQAKSAFDRRLKQSGLTLDDVKLQLRAQILQQKMSKEYSESVGEPSSSEAEEFYAKNRSLFATAGKPAPPFKQIEEQVKTTLRSQKLQGKQVEFQNELQRKWKAATLCAKGYVVAQCSNGPKLPDLVPPKTS